MSVSSAIATVTTSLQTLNYDIGTAILAVGGKSSQASNYVQRWADIIGGIAAFVVVISYFIAIMILVLKKGRDAEGTKSIGQTTMVHALALFGVFAIWGIVRIASSAASFLK